MNQNVSGAQRTRTILEKSRVVAKMLNADRETIRCNDLSRNGNPRTAACATILRSRTRLQRSCSAERSTAIIECVWGFLIKGKKCAILACSDIKNDLARPAVHKVRNFMLVQRVQMAVEQSWKPILCGLAQSSVGGDVRASKDMRCSGRS